MRTEYFVTKKPGLFRPRSWMAVTSNIVLPSFQFTPQNNGKGDSASRENSSFLKKLVFLAYLVGVEKNPGIIAILVASIIKKR